MLIGALIFIALIWYFSRPPATGNQVIPVPVKSGKFVISVTANGELEVRSNEKIQGVGAQISTWDNVVAILPDLRAMNSRTYVNEIDISKVKKAKRLL